jgi:hypothetical protein
MKLIQCPDSISEFDDSNTYVFLAGGISNCPDWQVEMVARFKDMPDDLVLVNPRRVRFDTTDESVSGAQIEWEYRHINNATAVIFWFPFHTLCPITLYELGVCAASGVPIFVGCHPGYARKFDVEHQLSLIRPDVVVHDNFETLVSQVKTWHK